MSELVFITTEDCHFCEQGRDRSMTKRFHALGGGMHADTASHTFILVDKAGTVRFNKDYPNMWIEPSTLLKLLPKVS